MGLLDYSPVAGQTVVTSAVDANKPRFRGLKRRGHVESFFVRANHPTERRAVWLKATVFKPHATQEPSVAEAWAVFFDGTHKKVWSAKKTIPLETLQTQAAPFGMDIDGCEFTYGERGGASRGELENQRGRCRWDLQWAMEPSPIAKAFSLYPYRQMLEGPFPKIKGTTPFPVVRFNGEIGFGDETIAVDEWLGMQGHNWGRAHAPIYAWGHCTFVDAGGSPHCTVEAWSGRPKFGPILSPMVSVLVARRNDRTYWFNELSRAFTQRAEIGDLAWTVRLRGSDGEAQLSMKADLAEVACLKYMNPDGDASYCFNSKLAWASLRINPVNEDGFECISEHGGALEILGPDSDPRIPNIT